MTPATVPAASLDGQRVLVLGGSVFVGKHLVDGLVRSRRRGRRAQPGQDSVRSARRGRAARRRSHRRRADARGPRRPRLGRGVRRVRVRDGGRRLRHRRAARPARRSRRRLRLHELDHGLRPVVGRRVSRGPRTSRPTRTARPATAGSRRWPRPRSSPATPRPASRVRSCVRPRSTGPTTTSSTWRRRCSCGCCRVGRSSCLTVDSSSARYGHVDDLCDAMITIGRPPRGPRRGVQHLGRLDRRQPVHRGRSPTSSVSSRTSSTCPMRCWPELERAAVSRRRTDICSRFAITRRSAPRRRVARRLPTPRYDLRSGHEHTYRLVPVPGLGPSRRSARRPGVEGVVGLRPRGGGRGADRG